MTQEGLAERIGRTAHTVAAIEAGRNFPNLNTLENLSEHLDTPIRDFFDFDERDMAASPKRIALLAAISDAARALDDNSLETAVAQIDALAKQGRRKG